MISYDEMLSQVEDGRLLMGVDSVFARRFYTDLTNSQREQEVGNAQANQSNTIRLFLGLESLAFLTAAVASCFAFHWWSALIIPGLVVLLFFWKSTASVGRPSFVPSLCLIALSWGIAFYFHEHGTAFVVVLVAAPLPHLFSRLVYRTAADFLRQLAKGSSRAYAFCADRQQKGVFFKDTSTGKNV
jgi:hypothetical protein